MSSPISGPGEADRRLALLVVDRSHALLAGILQHTERTFYSEQSMRILIDFFAKQLKDSLHETTETELLSSWEKRLPAFKKRLDKLAADGPLVLADGKEFPVMRETKARELVADPECLKTPRKPRYR